MESERDGKKTYLIIAILVGCIIILGPRLYSYSLRSTHLSTVKNDRNEASCQCGILFEYDVFDYPNTIQLCDTLSIGDVSESHLNKKFQKNVDGPLRKIEKCKKELPKFCEQELRRVSHSGTLVGGLNEKQVNILNSCSKQIDERRKLKNRKHYLYGTRKNQFQGYKPHFRHVIDSESFSPFQVDPKKKGAMALATPVFMLSVAVFFFYVFYKYVLKDKSEAKTSDDDEEKREFEFPHQEADSNKTLEDYGNEQVADILQKALSELSAKLETKVEVKIAENNIPVTGNQTSERNLTSNMEHLQADRDEGSVLLEYDKIKSQESEVCTTETTKDHGSMKFGSESVEVDGKDMIGRPLDPSIGKLTEIPLSQGVNHVHAQLCEEVTEFPVKELYFEKIQHLADTKLKTPEASKMPAEEVKPVVEYTYFTEKLSEPNVTTLVEPSQGFIIGTSEETSEEAKKISVVENVELVELELAQMSAAKNIIEIPEKILDTEVSTEQIFEQVEMVQLPSAEDITEIPQKLETIKVSTEEIVELIESVEMPAVEEDILETLEKTLDETSQVFIGENVEQIETAQILAAENFIEIPEKKLETSQVSSVEMLVVEPAQIPAAKKEIFEIPEKNLDEPRKVSTEEMVELVEPTQMPVVKTDTLEIPEKTLDKTSPVSMEETLLIEPAAEKEILEIPEKTLDEPCKVSTEEIVQLVETVQLPDVMEIPEKLLENKFTKEQEQLETSQILVAEDIMEIPENVPDTTKVSTEEMIELLEPAQMPDAEKITLEISEKMLHKSSEISTEEKIELIESVQMPVVERSFLEIPEKTLDDTSQVFIEENVEQVETAQILATENFMEIPEKKLHDETSQVSSEQTLLLEPPQIPAAEDILKIPEKAPDEATKVATEEIVELLEPAQIPDAEKEIMEIPEKTLDKTSPVSMEETLLIEPATEKEILEIPEKSLDEPSKVSTEEIVQLVETVQLPNVMEIPEKLLENKFTKEQEQLETSEILVAEDIMEISENVPDTTKLSTEEMIELLGPAQMPDAEENILEIPKKMVDKSSEVSTEEKIELVESAQLVTTKEMVDKIDEFANVSTEERVEYAVQEVEDTKETSQSVKISKEKAESGIELCQQLSENRETTESDKEAQHLASSRQKDVKILYVCEEMDTTGCNNLLESGVTQEPEGQLFMGSTKNETSAYIIDYLTTTMPDKVTTPCEEVLIDAFQKPANETEKNVPSTDQQGTIPDSSEDEKLGKLTMGNLDHEERIMVKDMHREEERDFVRDVCDAESVHKELQKHEAPGFGSWDKEDILESKDVQVFLEKQPSSVEVKEINEHGRDQLDVSEL